MLFDLLNSLPRQPKQPEEILAAINHCDDCIEATSELIQDILWISVLTWSDLSSLNATSFELEANNQKVIVNLLEFASDL